MRESNPEYVDYHRGGKIATRCRICGGQLITPQDMKLEYHELCANNYKSKNVKM